MAAEEKTIKTGSLLDFLQVVEDWRNGWGFGESAVYRGHTDFNWILNAKLFRDPDAKPVNSKGDDPCQVEDQLLGEHFKMKEAHDIERRLFYDFSRYLYTYRPDLVCTVPEEERSSTQRAMQEWRQLVIAQHYGLPTRLLDFTTNVLVALFFAVEEPVARRKTTKGECQEQDSVVWCIDVPKRLNVWQVWEKEHSWLSPLEFAAEGSGPPIANFVDTAYVPEHIDERIRAQGSVFMCEPRGKKEDWTLHVNLRDKTKNVQNPDTGEEKKKASTLKVRIPWNFRVCLRDQLDLVGINRATLFPDLGSAATYLSWAVHQRKRSSSRK
jgi:hypothetical protein